jgi:hypothetical protein
MGRGQVHEARQEYRQKAGSTGTGTGQGAGGVDSVTSGGAGGETKPPSVWLSALGLTGDVSRSSSDLLIKIGEKKKKKKKRDEDGKDNATGEGERSCPAGYVVLDKPNKYGSYCEPKEGLPEPKKEEPKKEIVTCKFGTVGTYPNCECPAGTEFAGPSRGCIKFTEKSYCTDYTAYGEGVPKGPVSFVDKCQTQYKGKPDCPLKPPVYRCCCTYRTY